MCVCDGLWDVCVCVSVMCVCVWLMMCVRILLGMGRQAGTKEGRKEGGADTKLKTKNPHVNVGNNSKTCRKKNK